MKFWTVILLALAGAAFYLRAADDRVRGLPANVKETSVTAGFSSEQYYDAPNEQKLKLRFSGASVTPLPSGLQEISLVRIEYFNTNGLTRALAETPRCELQPFEGVASSSGHLRLQAADGKLRMEGDGFVWRQNALTNELTLVISNHTVTVLKPGTNSIFKL